MNNSKDDLKIISYNVHSCVGSNGHYSPQRISSFLQSHSPSILCLQEIESNTCHQQTRLWSTLHSSNQPKEIASALKMEYFHFAPAICSIVPPTSSISMRERHDVKEAKGGGFGIAILSKHEILQVREWKYKRYGSKTLRNALACLISIPSSSSSSSSFIQKEEHNKKVWIINTHLGCHWGGEQYQQSKELVAFLKTLDEEASSSSSSEIIGIILCGDFNSLPFFNAIKEIKSIVGIVDTWEERGIHIDHRGGGLVGGGVRNKVCCSRKGCTYPVSCPMLRLDYIFYINHNKKNEDNNDCLALKCAFVILGNNKEEGEEKEEDQLLYKASDHLPLCAIFTIAR